MNLRDEIYELLRKMPEFKNCHITKAYLHSININSNNMYIYISTVNYNGHKRIFLENISLDGDALRKGICTKLLKKLYNTGYKVLVQSVISAEMTALCNRYMFEPVNTVPISYQVRF